MHRPLENSCSLKFLHFKDVEPHELNTVTRFIFSIGFLTFMINFKSLRLIGGRVRSYWATCWKHRSRRMWQFNQQRFPRQIVNLYEKKFPFLFFKVKFFQVQSGSFSYDAKSNLADWAPTKSDLRCLTTAGIKLISQNLNFERLHVTLDFAKEIFKYNKYNNFNYEQFMLEFLKHFNPMQNQTQPIGKYWKKASGGESFKKANCLVQIGRVCGLV